MVLFSTRATNAVSIMVPSDNPNLEQLTIKLLVIVPPSASVEIPSKTSMIVLSVTTASKSRLGPFVASKHDSGTGSVTWMLHSSDVVLCNSRRASSNVNLSHNVIVGDYWSEQVCVTSNVAFYVCCRLFGGSRRRVAFCHKSCCH